MIFRSLLSAGLATLLLCAVSIAMPIALSVAMSVALSVAAAAQTDAPAESSGATTLSDEDRSDIARAEAYLDSVRTLRSRFLQIAPDGSIAQGMLYISRPDRLRIEYDGPVPFLMVATGIWLILYDGELQQTSYLPLDASPAAVLIRDRVDLSDEVRVSEVVRTPGSLRIKLAEDGEAGKGAIYLTFSEAPLRLREWTVIDAQGQATQVALLNPEFGIDLDPVLFMYVAPGPDQFSVE